MFYELLALVQGWSIAAIFRSVHHVSLDSHKCVDVDMLVFLCLNNPGSRRQESNSEVVDLPPLSDRMEMGTKQVWLLSLSLMKI